MDGPEGQPRTGEPLKRRVLCYSHRVPEDGLGGEYVLPENGLGGQRTGIDLLKTIRLPTAYGFLRLSTVFYGF